MKLVFILFAFLPSFSWSLGEVCSVDGSKNKPAMEPLGDHVGFCMVFAIRSLIHQFRCQNQDYECTIPASLDILNSAFALDNEPKKRNAIETLKAINSRGTIADENCLKFANLFEPSQESGIEPEDFSSTFFKEIWQVAQPNLSTAERCLLSKKKLNDSEVKFMQESFKTSLV